MWAVLGATVANMVIGMLWYGPVFGGVWKRLMGITSDTIKKMSLSPGVAMCGMLVLALVMNFVLAHILTFASAYFNESGVFSGITGALWVWLGFFVPLTAGVFLWEGKSWKLWAFNAAYYLVVLGVAGAILGAFPA